MDREAVGKQRQSDQDGNRHAKKSEQFVQAVIFIGVRTRTQISSLWGRCSSQGWVRGRRRADPIWNYESNAMTIPKPAR